MSDRLMPMQYDQLEAQMADLGTALAFPRTPDLATAVGSRLRTPAGQLGARPRRLPLPRSLRRSLLLAAALALLIVGGALAVRFGLELLSIETGPIPTEVPASASPSPSALPPGALGTSLGLGRRLPLDEVDSAAAFDVLVPDALGQPDAVYVSDVALLGQVALVYAPREDLPASSLLSGAGLLVTQNQGMADAGLAHKIVDTSLATIEPVDVDGAPGVWISGEPHLFWYLAPDGSFINESRRLVGDTLAWERDGILYRIEGGITLSRALEIARSMRTPS
jgi:hypothetical protein